MRRQIGQRQSDTPGATEHSPLLHTQGFAKRLKISNQMRGGIVTDRREGTTLTATSLIEENNAEPSGIEKPAHKRRTTATGPAVQHHHGHTVRVAAFFHVKLVPLAYRHQRLPITVRQGE